MTSCEHPLKPGVDVLRTYLEKQVLVVFRWGKEEHGSKSKVYLSPFAVTYGMAPTSIVTQLYLRKKLN